MLDEVFHLDTHIHIASQGRERVFTIGQKLPDIASTSPWNGGDGQAVEEEEFSLEDLMGDDDSRNTEL